MTARLLTLTEVADTLGLSVYQARQEHARGVLVGRKVGPRLTRFTVEDVDAYVERIAERERTQTTGLTAGSKNRRRTAS